MRRKSLLGLSLAIVTTATVAACTEDLGSGAACPALCPDSNVEMIETVIQPVIFDTTLTGLPPLGTAGRLLAASRGDTLLTYGVVRFDVLPTRFRPSTTDTTTVPIANVLDARVRILTDTAGRIIRAPVTVEVYDVDTTAADTSNAAIAALIRPERLLGSVTLPQDTTYDTLRVALDDDALLARIQAESRLRIGIVLRSAESVQLRLIGLAATTDATHITFVPVSAEGAEGGVTTIQPRSTTPAESPEAAAQLADYTVVAIGAPTPPFTELGIGGMPSRRAYLRFSIPTEILDSATIVRATLILTQRPVSGIAPNDTIGVYPYIVTAGAAVTDLPRAASLIAAGVLIGLDSLKVVPSGTGERSLEVVRLLRAWRSQDPERVPHALVLRTAIEGYQPVEVRFFSSDAAENLRPRLRIVYIPRTNPGLP